MPDNAPVRKDADGGAPPPAKDREIESLAEEADHQINKVLVPEQALDMRQQRRARWIALGFLALLAVVSGGMMLALGLSVYFCDNSKALKIFLENEAHWPLGIFISGTFLSFIAVCGGLAFGVFTSGRRGRKEK